jgi:hypothetical protein
MEHRVAIARIPTAPAEITAARQQLADHLTNSDNGFCQRCGDHHCSKWREAAAALWWTDLDNSYEPHATEADRRLKREISLSRAGGMATNLKAPLTEAEVAALRHQLLIHDAHNNSGLCSFCQVSWCASWILAATCLQLNGLDQTFLTYVRSVAQPGHVLPT